jgi:hypothetical protein
MKKSIGVLASGLVVLAAAGCFDEKMKTTIHEDGSGSMRLESKTEIGANPFGGEQKKPTQADAEKQCYSNLAKYQGVVAWTDVKCEATETAVVWAATGWFDDISKVDSKKKGGKGTGANVPTWTKNADGTFTVEMPNDQPKKPGGQQKEPLDEDPAPPFVYEMLKTLHFVIEFDLPGDVVKADKPFKAEGRKAVFELTGAEMVKGIKEVEDAKAKAKEDVAAGKMTKEEANKKLKEKQKEAMPTSAMEDVKSIKIVCKGGEPADQVEAAKKALAEAKKSYAGSDTEKKVKAAAAEAAEKAEKGGMGGEK